MRGRRGQQDKKYSRSRHSKEMRKQQTVRQNQRRERQAAARVLKHGRPRAAQLPPP